MTRLLLAFFLRVPPPSVPVALSLVVVALAKKDISGATIATAWWMVLDGLITVRYSRGRITSCPSSSSFCLRLYFVLLSLLAWQKAAAL